MRQFEINIQTGEREFEKLNYDEFLHRLADARIGAKFAVSFYDDFADVSRFHKIASNVFKKGTRYLLTYEIVRYFKAEFDGRFAYCCA